MRVLVLIVACLTIGVLLYPQAPKSSAGYHKGHSAAYWHYMYYHNAKRRIVAVDRVKEQKKQLKVKFDYSVNYAIRLAAAVFDRPFDANRVVPQWELNAQVDCETGGTFSPFARNRSSDASGLLQFLLSTWRNQGFAKYGFSVFDPIANVLAGAKIVSQQGWRQWSCQP